MAAGRGEPPRPLSAHSQACLAGLVQTEDKRQWAPGQEGKLRGGRGGQGLTALFLQLLAWGLHGSGAARQSRAEGPRETQPEPDPVNPPPGRGPTPRGKEWQVPSPGPVRQLPCNPPWGASSLCCQSKASCRGVTRNDGLYLSSPRTAAEASPDVLWDPHLSHSWAP